MVPFDKRDARTLRVALCPECSEPISDCGEWFVSVTTDDFGRSMSAYFVLGCGVCSATIAVKRAEEVAAGLSPLALIG